MMLRAMVLFLFAFAASDPAHVAETEAFRKKHEEDYRRQYVPLAGLFSLKEGVNPYTTCPLPPRENRLTARILAGEKASPDP
jgi:hypothetical protein